MKWYMIPREEQETFVNIDYCEKKLRVYTNRKSVAERLIKKIGDPTTIDKTNGLVSGVTYERNLFDKDIAKFFSKTMLIGAFKE